MLFNETEMLNCRRTRLSKITQLTVTPEEKTQVIIGANGSGKTTLATIGFSVLPPPKKSIMENGHLKRTVTHDGRRYEINSHVGESKTEHDFIVDGVELNPGKTVGAQLELVKQHFRMTPEIHSVLTGETTFTGMTSAERQKWIIRLSDNDFGYVLGFNERAKTNYRKTKILLEEYGKRLNDELKNTLDEEAVQQMVKKQAELNRELSILYRLHTGGEAFGAIEAEIASKLARLAEKITTALKSNSARSSTFDIDQIDSLDGLMEQIKGLETDISVLSGRHYEISASYETAHREMEKLKEVSGVDLQELSERINTLKTKEAALLSSIKHIPKDLNLSRTEAKNTIEGINELILVFSQFGTLKVMDYTGNDHRQAFDRFNALLQQRLELERDIERIDEKIDHIRSAHSVDCPKCAFTFKPGVEETDSDKLIQLKANKISRIEELNVEIQRADEVLSGYKDVRGVIDTISGLINEFPNLSRLNEVLKRNGLSFRHGSACIEICRQFVSDVKALQIRQDILTELAPLEATVAKATEGAKVSIDVKSSYEILKSQVDQISTEMNEKKQRLVLLSTKLNLFNALKDKVVEYEDDLKEVEGLIEKLVEASRQELLGKAIDDAQKTLAIITEALNTHDNQQTIVKDLNVRVRNYTEQLEISKRIVDELSPSGGIIAEQVMSYINIILDTVNGIIASISHYPLVIKPCDIEAGELNYKFPVWAGEEDNEIEDISKGSDGQKALIDLGFKLAVYHFLDFKRYPLYLDEVGRALDPVNRENLIPVLNDLIADETFGQVFIISHDIGIYGSLDRTDIIVLDKTGVPPGTRFNENVTIL